MGTEGRNTEGGWPPRSPAWWCPAPERWHSDNDDASDWVYDLEKRGLTATLGAPRTPGPRRRHHMTIALTLKRINPLAVNSPRS